MSLIASDNRCAILGLGKTGISCARYLAHQGRPFAIADSRQNPPELAALQAEFPEVEIRLGEFDAEWLSTMSELVVSPGISLQEPAIATALQQGVVALGDIDLFCRAAKAPIVAITGSNGKSTVTTLVGNMAQRAGRRVAVGGNIGIPALELLDDSVELYVLELSSFQLERCSELRAEVATVLNLSADHMDRYQGMPDYHRAKHRIFRGCRQAVSNRDDRLTRPLLPAEVTESSYGLSKADLGQFGLLDHEGERWLAYERTPLLAERELRIAGSHNVANALAALALGRAVALPMAAMLEELRAFAGLEHRCQFVAEINGVRYYNDSKGTNVGAAIASVEGLKRADGQLVLIAGGVGKGANFSELATAVAEGVRSVLLMGEAAEDLQQVLLGAVSTERVDSLASAVERAAELAEAGDVVLLSPACASFDMFANFEARGDAFIAAVEELSGVVR